MITSTCHAVAFTGAFGSGCTTASKHLATKMSFTNRKLSDCIRAKWSTPDQEPRRVDLQKLGDDMRRSEGLDVLAKKAVTELEGDAKSHDRVVIDGVRNLGEIEFLRDYFGFNFTLIAVLADEDTRWGRIGDQYTDKGLGQSEFLDDDARDKNEETPTGQEVELCIDAADIVLANDERVPRSAFYEKIVNYTERAIGLRDEAASSDEVFMHQASSTRHGSRCVKRQVGAVIVDTRGWIVSAGYNENPTGTLPCVIEPSYKADGPCYRDIVRNSHFRALAESNALCPVCGESFGVVVGPPWHCPRCKAEGRRTNLEQYFMPDRAMSSCTAIHAEAAAIFAAAERTRGATLYSTTFPCMQCAEKIIHVGIKRVVYTEAYPDTLGRARFELAGLELCQFEGVKSSAFERIYGHPSAEATP